MHGEEVDDVGPVLPVLIAASHQVRGDRVTVRLAADQDAADVVASRRREGKEEVAEVGIVPAECHASGSPCA
jgi:hypothetical protein